MGDIYEGEILGNLIIDEGDDATRVTSIKGNLYVRPGATCNLPACTSIGGNLKVLSRAICNLPICTSVGGGLFIRTDAICNLPVCTSVGGNLEIPEGNLTAPLLKSIKGERMRGAEEQSLLFSEVIEAALAGADSLKMNAWHSCDTSHCLAGWAIHKKGAEGYALEAKVGAATAGALLLGLEAASMFFLSTKVVREKLEAIRGRAA